MPEIEIFKKGAHVAANGERLAFGDRELDEICETYNPQHFRAPLILTHNTFKIPDHKLADYSADDGTLPTSKHLAFGFPDKLKRVGDAIVGVFNKISPKFTKLQKEGAILAISSSLYKPQSPANPYPGKWALRHIAGLGTEAPAVKGMTPLSLSELVRRIDTSDEFAIAFSSVEEGVVDFSVDFGAWAWNQIGDAFRGLREWLIDQYDMETADRVLPSSLIGILQQEAAMPDPGMWEVNSLRERIARLEGMCESEEKYNMNENETADLSEREAELAQREQAIAAREAELRKKEFTSFCEGLKGRLTPAIASTEEVVAFMEYINSGEEVEFSEEKKIAPIAWFKEFLSKIPQSVPLDRLPTEEPRSARVKVDNSEDFDEESRQLDAEIRQLQKTQRATGNELTYEEALDQILAAQRR